MKSELEIVVESELDTLGFDLVDLRRHGTRARPAIEDRIDRRDGERVTVDDCARVSRAIERLVGEQTELQVSSPGADRPLKTEKDWRRFVGRRAVVKSAVLGGRKEVGIAGVDGTGDDFVVTLRESSDGAGAGSGGGSEVAPKQAPGARLAAAGAGSEVAPKQAPSREAAKAREYRVPLSAIDEARLTFHWDRGVTDGRFR